LRVRALAFSADGSRLASAGDDRTVNVWDAAGGQLLTSLPEQSGKVRAIAFCDERRLAVGSTDNSIRVWNLETQLEEQLLDGHVGSVTSLAFNPTTGTLTSGSFDTSVRVWNVLSSQQDNTARQPSRRGR
jgi:WD40 repeat protein